MSSLAEMRKQNDTKGYSVNYSNSLIVPNIAIFPFLIEHHWGCPAFLFISFIENGFKHAMDHSFGEPFIYITLRVGNGQLVLNVINSTDADLELQAKKLNGMGIAHSRSLLELLYPSSYDLDIIQTEKDEGRTSELRMRNARERLENLYPDSHTLDVILNKSTFTVSLILKTFAAC